MDRPYHSRGFAAERERAEHLFVLYEKMRRVSSMQGDGQAMVCRQVTRRKGEPRYAAPPSLSRPCERR